MTIKEAIRTIQQHPVVMSSIPLEAQMGYPAIVIRNEKLCLHFLYYFIELTDDSILLYPPRYSLMVAAPFHRIVKYDDYAYNSKYSKIDFSSSIGSIKLSADASIAQSRQEENLFQLGDLLMEHFEKGQIVSQSELKEYRQQLYQTVNPVFIPMYRDETE